MDFGYVLVLMLCGLLFFLLVFFFVLVERKVLSIIQSRVGPNKVSMLGLLQSLADFLKLIGKINLFNSINSNYYYRGILYSLSILVFLLSAFCFIWFFISQNINFFCSGKELGWLIILSSFAGYGFLLAGWGSSSKYSLYGAMRAAFSSITFEGVLMCVVIIVGMSIHSYSFNSLLVGSWCMFISLLSTYLLFLISILCECQRTPFDYSESESDLVSGFNTDYYGGSFAVIFASEYAVMVFFGWLCSILFFGGVLELLFSILHLFFLIFVRACFPRMRYDFFIGFMWKVVLILLLINIFSLFIFF